MTIETLHKVRIAVPGILLFLFAIPLFSGNLDSSGILSSLSLLQGVAYLIIIIGLGGIYHFFDFRSLVDRWSTEKIRSSIKTKMLEPFKSEALISQSIGKIMQGRGLLNIFYGFVDNDLSLKEKAKRVYFNGAFWSTVADMRVISAVAYFVYIIAFIISRNLNYFIVSIGMAFFFVLSFALMPMITKRHIELGDEQIEYILLKYKSDLHDKITELAKA